MAGPAAAIPARQPVRATPSQLDYSVATTPPTLRQRQLASAVIVMIVAALGVMLPYVDTPLPRFDSFIPAIMAITFAADLITAALLFGQFSATGSRALLMLASGYLYSGLIVIPHALTFPGAFAPTGLLGAGPQSSAWLSVFWRLGLAVALASYAALKSERPPRPINESPRRVAIFWRVTFVLLLVCALALAVTRGDPLMPSLIIDGRVSPLGHYLNGTSALLNILALLLLWRRGNSILDMWLMVSICVLICETAMVALFIKSRFSLGFYSIRIISLLGLKVVLIALLWETIRLHAKLMVANRELRSERTNRLASAEAAVAAVAHEVKQPLTSIIARADAGRTLPYGESPDASDANKRLFAQIKSDAFRVNGVFANFLAIFREDDRHFDVVNINALVLETIRLMHSEIAENRIVVRTNLAEELPPILGSQEQLREVFLNLIQNAVEAMATTRNQPLVLSVTSRRLDAGAIAISLVDTGPGVDPKRLPGLFDAFVTTKAKGTGLGLAICKMIVERHGGGISAAPGAERGLRFEIKLPSK